MCCSSLPRRLHMHRKASSLLILLVLFGIACGSMNRVTPSEMDAKTMEADVRSKIAEVVPDKAVGIQVEVDNHAVVTLSGNVDNASDRDKIIDAAKSVNGVTRVISHLAIKP